jgi:hypothetical protein
MDRAETAAKSIIESLMRGARMHYRESQSAGEHDFDLEYATGLRVPLEVTMSTDEIAEAKAAEINRSKRGPFVPRIRCQRDWWVHPLRHAHIRKIRKDIDLYLAAIEAEGLEHFNAFVDAADSAAVNAILEDLGIEYGQVTKWKSPCIAIATPGGGGLVHTGLINEAGENEAFKDDNKRKLRAATGSEKHLFVYVTPMRHVVWVAIRDGMLPASGPQLPPEVTHVWVATWAGDGAWHSVWHAQRNVSWSHMGQVNIETGAVKSA